jgi:hypothetical protein
MIGLNCSNILNIVDTIKYNERARVLELRFTTAYENTRIFSSFDPKHIEKSLRDLESKIKKQIPKVVEFYMQIEEVIYNNLDLLAVDKDKQEDRTKNTIRIQYVRKYEKDGKLLESILIADIAKFIFTDGSSYQLLDEWEVGNYVLRPKDNLTTHNPLPYSFSSEQELMEYINLAKIETIDSLFEKILKEYRNYVNTEEHTLVILAADTLYSYFQTKFGTTHYNILVGETGSGKNSALLVFRTLGYGVFYITSASAANYYTFLGDIQEGQGSIAEDEADNIGKDSDKKNVIKTGYASGGSVPKTSFSQDGQRHQKSYLTFCLKWFAMEELPFDKNNRGIFDRSFIHYFVRAEVKYNIKEILSDKNSELHKALNHLRKILFAFKLSNYHFKFPEIQTNLDAREAELAHFLLRMFKDTQNFEKVRIALSKLIYDKTESKSDSIEAKITESLNLIIRENSNINRDIFEISNEEFYDTFKVIAEAKDDAWDSSGSTFYLPEGIKISKYKLSKLLTSKFRAKPTRTNQSRGFIVKRKDIEKISKQYVVIEEIKIINNEQYQYDGVSIDNEVTEVTQVTDFKSVSPSHYMNSSTDQSKGKIERDLLKSDQYETGSNSIDNDNKASDITREHTIVSEPGLTDQYLQTEMYDDKEISSTIPIKSVNSVTSVTACPPQYPCYFCGTNYQTYIDFDMGNHFIEKHKSRLISLPVSGNLETKIEWAITETRRRLYENDIGDQKEDYDYEN